MIAMLAATLLIYLLSEVAGVRPLGPIATAIACELTFQLIKQARKPKTHRDRIEQRRASFGRRAS